MCVVVVNGFEDCRGMVYGGVGYLFGMGVGDVVVNVVLVVIEKGFLCGGNGVILGYW